MLGQPNNSVCPGEGVGDGSEMDNISLVSGLCYLTRAHNHPLVMTEVA